MMVSFRLPTEAETIWNGIVTVMETAAGIAGAIAVTSTVVIIIQALVDLTFDY